MASDQRNIAVIAHIDAGKTTLTEQLLYCTGATVFAGSVDEGSTVTDWKRQEQERGITIGSAAVSTTHRGVEITIVDTPGHVDFTLEVERTLRVIEGGAVVVSGPEGVQAQTETVWRQAERYELPMIAFINKIDREGFDDYVVQDDIRERLGIEPLPLQIPLVASSEEIALLDVLRGEVLTWDMPSHRSAARPSGHRPLTPEEEVERLVAWERIVDRVAEHDPALMRSVIEEEPIDGAALTRAIARAVEHRACLPLLYGAARGGVGVARFADAIVDLLPPASRSRPQPVYDRATGESRAAYQPDPDGSPLAFVFKIERRRSGEVLHFLRVFSGNIDLGTRLVRFPSGDGVQPQKLVRIMGGGEEEIGSLPAGTIGGLFTQTQLSAGDMLAAEALAWSLEPVMSPHPVVDRVVETMDADGDARMREAAQALVDEDPSLAVSSDPTTGQLTLSGIGELQLELAISRIQDAAGVTLRAGPPKIHHYRLCLSSAIGKREARDPVTGHEIAFSVTLEPNQSAPELEIALSPQLRLKPPQEAAAKGGVERALLGRGDPAADVVGVRIVVTEIAGLRGDTGLASLNQAAFHATQKALERADERLAESWVRIEVTVPGPLVGAVVADLERRLARIRGTETRGRVHTCFARGPLSRFLDYSTSLRSLTGGQAVFSIEPHGIDLSPLGENR